MARSHQGRGAGCIVRVGRRGGGTRRRRHRLAGHGRSAQAGLIRSLRDVRQPEAAADRGEVKKGDYVLVKVTDLAATVDALRAAGHTVHD